MSPKDPVPIRTFYRIVWTNPPTLEDALSHAARKIVVQVEDDEIGRISTGISVYRTIAQARKTARKRPPWFGRGFIAQITIPPGSTARVERTTKTAGHYTLWAEPEDILLWVDHVEPVSGVRGEEHDL